MKKTILVILIALTFISFVIAGATILSDKTMSVDKDDRVILEKMNLVDYTYEDTIAGGLATRCVYNENDGSKLLRFCVSTFNEGTKIIDNLDKLEQQKLTYLISEYKKQQAIINKPKIEPARTGRTIVQEK